MIANRQAWPAVIPSAKDRSVVFVGSKEHVDRSRSLRLRGLGEVPLV